MRKLITYLTILAMAGILFQSCDSSEKHFLKDSAYRAEVQKQFEERKKIAEPRSKELLSVFDREDLTLEEREALEFLFAYMPLSDLADYEGEYFLNQVRGAFKAREYFDWGKKIPEELFRHFVLVYRVNTENLDEARDVFFDELKDRVKGMSMEEAVLEINHWCHEKITYRATDRRTSSPLQLMTTSWGRCGEQSTFTVMALRAVGIPARQCYTPRWVHTDSNHAWVEAWVDGQWRYIGASEPEAELDVAWFDGPVKRAMMVHTNVFGNYQGVEDKTSEYDLYSIINVLDTYADTREFTITVRDANNKPVENATVKYEVYNYAEFYPIATILTDKNGVAHLKTNSEGDVLVWAQKDDQFAYKHIKQNDLENVLTLGTEVPVGKGESFVMDVPREKPIRELAAEKIAQNAILLAKEDSIRNAYMQTFISEADARKFADEQNLEADIVWKNLSLAQGNWKEIQGFYIDNKDFADKKLLATFPTFISDKDLRDTPKEYLNDHFRNAEKVGLAKGAALQIKDVYSPHIGFELIRPWRSFFQSVFSKEQIAEYQANPASIVEYVRGHVTITDSENYYNCPVSPRGVYEMQLADKHSRDIFFVALCRSFGVAARLEPSTNRPQYFDGQWHDVLFEAVEKELPKGKVTFADNKSNLIRPGYSSHYTIARFDGGGYKTLNYRGDANLNVLPGTVNVDAGKYRLTVGSRANNGSVTVLHRFFEVPVGQTVTQQITMPKPEGLLQVQGIVDPNTIVELEDGTKSTLKVQMNGKGVVLVFADPDKEPTKHILQDLPAVSEELNAWGGGVVFMVPDDKKSAAFDASAFKGLPTKSVWANDEGRAILNAAASAIQLDFSNNFPLVLYINTNGGVIFSHQGYTIGIGENIVKTIKMEQETF